MEWNGYALTIVGSKAPYALGAGVHGVQCVSDVMSITSFFRLRSLSANAHTIPSPMDGRAVDRKSPRERAKSRLASYGHPQSALLVSSSFARESLSFLLFNLTALLIINGF